MQTKLKQIKYLVAIFAVLIFPNAVLAAQYSRSARVDVRIGDAGACILNTLPVNDLETPCGWPATGYISTLPFTASHASLSAIDIAASDYASGWPIYASHDGITTVITNTNPDPRTPENPPDRKVYVASSKYVTRYQHLLKQCVSDGAVVTRGTLIGLMDSTGYSTGHHLHYDIANPDGSALSLEQFNLLVPPYVLGAAVVVSYSGPTTC